MVEKTIQVEVAAGMPDKQVVISLVVPEGTTLIDAVKRSGLAEHLPELEIDPQRLGIFGRRRRSDSELRDGDRVEVYRPLTADPKEVRRQLAELERTRKAP